MNANHPVSSQTNSSEESKKMLIAMVSIGIFCALLIVLVYEGSKERIDRLRTEALEKAVFKVLPGISNTRMFLLGTDGNFTPVEAPDGKNPVVYAGYDDAGKFLGVAIEASGQGYADVIRVLYGYHPHSQTIVGFYVLESKETPGLGDKIEKDENFLANFKALSVKLDPESTRVQNKVIPVKQGGKSNPWEVEGITGATISSRAIGNIIGESSSVMVPLIYNQIERFKEYAQNNFSKQ